MKILHKITGQVLFEHKTKSMKVCIGAAIKAKANLSYSNLRGSDLHDSDLSYSNLHGSNLHGSNLSYSNLSGSDLSYSNLSYSNLHGSDLSYSNLRGSDLSYSNLHGSDLHDSDLSYSNLHGSNLHGSNLSYSDLSYSDLSYSDLDFSSGITFKCTSFNFKANIRLAAQIAYHFCRIDFGDCEDAKAAQTAIRDLANKFHRVEECGKIK
jgi:uncharacterized protein YjbI with pentapeptide repeats